MGSRYEDRKVKSRIAAQGRRNCENREFRQLAECLPLDNQITRNLDKASIIRICISFLKLQQQLGLCSADNDTSHVDADNHHYRSDYGYFHPGNTKIAVNSSSDTPKTNHFLKANKSFVVCIDRNRRVLYSSKSAASVIGVQQIEIIGHNICSIVHEDDKIGLEHRLESLFSDHDTRQQTTLDSIGVDFVVKMKCTFEKRLGGQTKVTSVYKPMHFSGLCANLGDQSQTCFTAIVTPFQFQTNSANLHSLQTLVKCDPSLLVTEVLENATYKLSIENDTSLYSIVHPSDSQQLIDSHRELLQTGHCIIANIKLIIDNGSAEALFRIQGSLKTKPNSEDKMVFMIFERLCLGSEVKPTPSSSVSPLKRKAHWSIMENELSSSPQDVATSVDLDGSQAINQSLTSFGAREYDDCFIYGVGGPEKIDQPTSQIFDASDVILSNNNNDGDEDNKNDDGGGDDDQTHKDPPFVPYGYFAFDPDLGEPLV